MSYFQDKVIVQILAVVICMAVIDCNRKEDSKISEKSLDSIKQKRNIVTQNDDKKTIESNADLFFSVSDYKSALELYDKLIAIDSMNGFYYYRKGTCLIELDKYNESIISFLKSADLNYNLFESYRAIGFTYALILNDNEKAILYFEKCIRIKPDDDEIKTFLKKLSIDSNKRIKT